MALQNTHFANCFWIKKKSTNLCPIQITGFTQDKENHNHIVVFNSKM